MPTTPIRRVRVRVTGVGGSPYYLNGYFTADTGTTAQCQNAWMKFLFGGPGPTVGALPTSATATVESEVPVIDPATGQPISVETSPGFSWGGSSTDNLLPTANQFLVRWRTGNFENGREVRGRTNIPCPTEATSTPAGRVEPSIVTAYNSRAFNLIDDANTVFVVWSKKNGLWWAARSGSTWDQFAVLRSRRD